MGQKVTNLKLIQGEEISFTIALKNQDGDPVDLTAATLSVKFDNADDTTLTITPAVSGSALLGKMTVALTEAQTLLLKVGELQTIEVVKVTAGVTRIVQIKKALSVSEQAY